MNPSLLLFLFLLSVPIAACGQPPRMAASSAAGPVQTVSHAQAVAGTDDSLEALRRLAREGNETERRRALARLAIHLRANDRLEEAADAFAEAAEANPIIRAHLLLQLAEVEEERGELDGAADALRRILGMDEASAAVKAQARLRLATVLATSGDAGAAKPALAEARGIEIDTFTDEEFARLAAALEEGGLDAEAAALRLRILQEYPGSRWAETHYDRLALLPADDSPLAHLSFSESVDLADRLGRVNRYDQALDLLERIAERFPDRTGSAPYRYTRARSLFNSRNYRQVTEEPSRPGEPYHLAIEFLRGHAYWRSERPEQFLAAMNRLIREHPRSDEAASAKIMLAKYYQTDDRDLERSARLLEEGIALGGPGNEGVNLWTLGWTYVQAERHQDALRTFARYLERYPDASYTANALFWSGKIHERLGNREQRDAFFRRLFEARPYDYYSYRAREILGDETLPPSEIESGHSFPEQARTPASDPRLAVPVELRAVGLERDAAIELRRIASGQSIDPVLAWRLADFYASGGEPLRAIGILNRHFRDIIRHGGTGIPRRFWEVLYPRMHWDEIRKASAAANVDPWLAVAVIRQESAWEPTTVSSAGAVGLMQIMPNEAASIAKEAGLGAIERNDLFDPVTNIRVGTAELRQKLDAMDGHRVLAIASYNAGESAVRRWMSRTPVDDLDVFVDSIPYAETRLYVITVTRNLHEYERVYGGDS